MKKIVLRKTETIRMTSAAQPLYAFDCGGLSPKTPVLP